MILKRYTYGATAIVVELELFFSTWPRFPQVSAPVNVKIKFENQYRFNQQAHFFRPIFYFSVASCFIHYALVVAQEQRF